MLGTWIRLIPLVIGSCLPIQAGDPPEALQTLWVSDQSWSMYANGTGMYSPQQRRIWIGRDSVRSEYLAGSGDGSYPTGYRCSLKGKILRHRIDDPKEDGIVQLGIMLIQVGEVAHSTLAGTPIDGKPKPRDWVAKPGEFTTLFYALHAEGWAEIDMHPGDTFSKAEASTVFGWVIDGSQLDEWGVEPDRCQRFESKKTLESLWKLKQIDYRDAADVSRLIIGYQAKASQIHDIKMGWEVFYTQGQGEYLVEKGYNPFTGRIALSYAGGHLSGDLWTVRKAFESELALLVTATPEAAGPAGSAKVKAWTEKVRTAVAAGDTAALMKLYHWDGVDPAIRREHERRWQGLLAFIKEGSAKPEIQVLGPRDVLFDDGGFENDGRSYQQNFRSIGALRMTLTESDPLTITLPNGGPEIRLSEPYHEWTFPVGLTENGRVVLTSPILISGADQESEEPSGKSAGSAVKPPPTSIDSLRGRLKAALTDGDFVVLRALYDWSDTPQFLQDRELSAWRQLREQEESWSNEVKANAREIAKISPDGARNYMEYLESTYDDPTDPPNLIVAELKPRMLFDLKHRELLAKGGLVRYGSDDPRFAECIVVELGIEDDRPLAGTLSHEVLIAKQSDDRFALVPLRWP